MDNFIPKLIYGPGPTTIVFDYPPDKDEGEKKTGVKRESISVAGVRQITLDRTEITREVQYSFLSPSLKDDLETFFDAWGKYGKSFKYFEHNENVSYVDYELQDLVFSTRRQLPKAGDFIYGLTLKFRRYTP